MLISIRHSKQLPDNFLHIARNDYVTASLIAFTAFLITLMIELLEENEYSRDN